MEKAQAAIYCRLSQDDGSLGESGSIQTQKAILTQYCQEHHMEIVDCYCDDGWSGTNFDRPAFQRMIGDIEAGRVNTVIVKDLSRFGREYAQMGLYIEHYFEEKGVRFLSLAENIDSSQGLNNLVLPFTNVINSLYARQASEKTKAAHRARAKNGMFLGSRAPYGYQKDPNDRHHLIVDPEAAEVVKEIFRMFADGIGYVRMTKILRERNILNPQAYFNQNNPDYYKHSDYWRKPFDWHATSVRAILNNPVYLGKLTFGKTKTKGFFDKRRVATEESDWIVVEHTHEPLVSQELWDTVHQMMKARRRENSSGHVQPFAGLVKCAGCGSSLNASYDKKKGKYTGFSCWVYKNYGKQRCTSHAIGWQTLNRLVLEDIRRNAQVAKLAAARYVGVLLRTKLEKEKGETVRAERELKKAEKRIGELDKILAKLYEDQALGKISEVRYQAMAPGYEAEQASLQERVSQLREQLAHTQEVQDNVEQFVPLIQKYTDIQELTPHILNELIEKIVVHEKKVEEDGSKSQMVEIHYKFVGCIDLSAMLNS
ncbi:MAG TPA: recombinase family protein [Candidatus Acutalibacter stercorigallinarum]|nr:recombinase family protein [Candidatus Acutalibacter stercorigallinarum]